MLTLPQHSGHSFLYMYTQNPTIIYFFLPLVLFIHVDNPGVH